MQEMIGYAVMTGCYVISFIISAARAAQTGNGAIGATAVSTTTTIRLHNLARPSRLSSTAICPAPGSRVSKLVFP